jgi:hypothetical protein
VTLTPSTAIEPFVAMNRARFDLKRGWHAGPAGIGRWDYVVGPRYVG